MRGREGGTQEGRREELYLRARGELNYGAVSEGRWENRRTEEMEKKEEETLE